jgi:AsmA protein
VEKPFKTIVSAFAAVVFLLIAAVCVLPFIINPNDYKSEIAAAVKDKTGRELTLDGELKLSLFPWIGVSTGKMTLGNAPDFQDKPFATIEEGNVKVLLLPLLSKKVEISRIVLKGMVLNLAKNQQGLANWTGLTGSADIQSATPAGGHQQHEPSTPTDALASFTLGGITIDNAQINWDDQQAGRHIEITGLNLNTDKFMFDEPMGIAVSLTASDSKVIQTIKLNTELSVNEKLDAVTLRHSDIQLTSSGETVPGQSLTAALTVADMALDMSRETAKIDGLQLKSGDLSISAQITGSNIKDKPSFLGPVTVAAFSPAKVLQQLGIALPRMQDANALNNLSANFELAATADSAELKNLSMMLDDTQIKGSAVINGFASPAISFNLGLDSLDMNRYLPPPDKSVKAIASPAVALAAAASAVPAETLKKLNVNGTATLGKLKVSGLTMQDIRLSLNAKNGEITTEQSINQFYRGSYTGNLSMNMHSAKTQLAVNEKIDHVQIEPLLKDFKGKARMDGIVNASAQLQGQGNNADELKTSLQGRLTFSCKDSVIKGFNLQKIIDEGKSLIKGSALPADAKNDQTLFSEMSGTATLKNGQLQNDDLVAKSSKLRIDGKGSINLNTDAVDYKVDAKLLNADKTAADPEQVKGSATILIAGTLDNPSYTVDIASLLTDKNKEKIDKLINKIDKKIGPGVGNLLKNLLHKQ